MDEAATTKAIPAWYWAIAVAALLFEGLGTFLFVSNLTLDPATLPLDQRSIFEATPQWMNLAWAVATGAGLIGAIGLLVRRRFAEPALLVSLLAVVVQVSGIFLVKQLRELTPEDHLIVPVTVLLIAYAFWQSAKLAKRRGWLR